MDNQQVHHYKNNGNQQGTQQLEEEEEQRIKKLNLMINCNYLKIIMTLNTKTKIKMDRITNKILVMLSLKKILKINNLIHNHHHHPFTIIETEVEEGNQQEILVEGQSDLKEDT